MTIPDDLWKQWPFDPLVWVGLVVGATLYLRGLQRLWLGDAGRRAVPAWRPACFAGALLLGAIALLSPLDVAADEIASAHMAQHLLLTIGVAPLLVLSRPVLVGSLALPRPLRRFGRRVRLPVGPAATVPLAVTITAGHTITSWGWHVPAFYEAALTSDVVHALEHGTLLAGGVALWWLVADARGRHAGAAAVLAVFATALLGSALAAALTFSGSAFYAEALGNGPAAWGLTALEDQQLAGGLLWFPGGLAYIIAGAAAFLRWMRQDEQGLAVREEILRASLTPTER